MVSHVQATDSGWGSQRVTERVHAKGAFIFAQLMHGGRVSHDSLMPPGEQIVAPSAVQMAGLCHTKSGKVGSALFMWLPN
jgi:N-ethylmaleimide reductase